ncbi:unnamed protein product [[Candida] boidinii]|nr:unnamed protein product [[Candida] boidinii]
MSKYPSTVSASSEITPNSISDYSDNEYIKQDILPKAKCSSNNNNNRVGDNEEKENILVDLNRKTSETDLTGSGIEPALYYILKDNSQNPDNFDNNDNDINNENSKNESRIRVDTVSSAKNNILNDTNIVYNSPVSQISMNKVGSDSMFKDKNFNNYETASTRD